MTETEVTYTILDRAVEFVSSTGVTVVTMSSPHIPETFDEVRETCAEVTLELADEAPGVGEFRGWINYNGERRRFKLRRLTGGVLAGIVEVE